MSSRKFATLQQLGRALMLPVAVLPFAGLVLRLGQPDLLGIPFLAQVGGAVFAHLALLFAVGVAVGFAKDQHGVAGLAGAAGYVVLSEGMKAINPAVHMGVLSGLVMGVVAGVLYNRYCNIRLPAWLAFFGGRRFVPIAACAAGLVLALVFGLLWPHVQVGIDRLGQWLIGSGPIGLFLYGTLNRLLLVTGLHHILNNLAWFVFGDFTNAAGVVVHGDLKRFFAGDPTAGAFMAGFFPVMMFGLPAACLAMYRNSRPENRGLAAGLLLSMGLTSLLTGITEPIEFAFMFLAPVLYGLHALLTGLSMALMHMLGVQAGFTFSAGAFDYVLSYGIATRAWVILPFGLAYAALYYGLFTFFIRRFDLMTPGRDADMQATVDAAAARVAAAQARSFLAALGGAPNVLGIVASTTRLHLSVADAHMVDAAQLIALGAKGVLRPGEALVDIVVAQGAEALAEAMRMAKENPQPPLAADGPAARAHGFVDALGGAPNLQQVDASATRLLLALADDTLVHEPSLKALGAYAVIRMAPGGLQVVLGPIAGEVAEEMRGVLRVPQ